MGGNTGSLSGGSMLRIVPLLFRLMGVIVVGLFMALTITGIFDIFAMFLTALKEISQYLLSR